DHGGGAVHGVGGGDAHQDVDLAPDVEGGVHEVLQLGLVAHRAGDGQSLEALGLEFTGNLFAGIGLAAGDDHASSGLGKLFGDRLADAIGGTGDHCDLAGQIKKRAYG